MIFESKTNKYWMWTKYSGAINVLESSECTRLLYSNTHHIFMCSTSVLICTQYNGILN